MSETEPFDASAVLKRVSTRPGVYRMLEADGKILYVGKAGNLRKRLSSHFRRSATSAKADAMMRRVADVEVTVTNTEGEALLLENELIKEHQPRYNVVLRDDKSYPYIFLDTSHEFPRLTFHRGAKNRKGRYFGPYPSAGAVRDTLHALQTLFMVRQCEDAFFRNRSRPCLQYQIDNCSAPCVGYVDAEHYAQDVEHTIMFLEGRDSQIIETLGTQMDNASGDLNYEFAATLRDRIAQLQRIRSRNYMRSERGNLDIVACHKQGGQSCVQVFFVREGRNLGNKAFYPSTARDARHGEILYAFVTQYYLRREPPQELLLSHAVDDAVVLADALSDHAGRRVVLSHNLRGERARWMRTARENARIGLQTRLASRAGMAMRLQSLADTLGLDDEPRRMECFDISHTGGEGTVGSCVVFDSQGALKQEYRRFNIKDIEGGDDYAAMEQVIRRRYTRVLKENRDLPDVIFIDGGTGQLSRAAEVLSELQLSSPALVGVAKGAGRRPGLETLHLASRLRPLQVGPDTPGLHLIQEIRDEAHRFAIFGHRRQRSKKRQRSTLEEIPGLGPKRRQQLFRAFGGLRGITRAGVEDLASVTGISRQLAQRIYDHYHESDIGAAS
jgi:excinuclease ABC subunit C